MSTNPSGDTVQGLRIFVSYPRGGAAHSHAETVHADLEKRGAQVWRDERSIEEGDNDWYARIRDGLERADVVACIVGADSDGCRWQQREMLRADQLALPVAAFRTAPVALPFYMIEKQPVELNAARVAASLETLAQKLAHAASSRNPGKRATATPAPDTGQRQRERAYLENLLYGELSDREARYEPLAGHERAESSLARSHKGLRIDTHFMLKAFQLERTAAPEAASKDCDDVLDVYRELPTRRIRRLAVLGEPGAGKSFSLERIACDYARRALHDPESPLPLLVRLGLWTREGDTLLAFIERQLGELGRDVSTLRDKGRGVLLLDGLNEIPPGQRVLKTRQIREIAEDERYCAVVVSCRERDFDADYRLPFDTLTLQPLSPVQIRRFLQRAYTLQHGQQAGVAKAEQRFWQIAGGEALREVWQVWDATDASFEQFWMDEGRFHNPKMSGRTTRNQDELWRAARGKRSLLRLAANPYLLHIMMSSPQIPPNRAQLFDGFLQVLHERERASRVARHDARSVPDRQHWQGVLTTLAEAMQHAQRTRDTPNETDAPAATATSLAQGAWPASLTTELLNFSIDASVLQRVGNDVRFTHQLLQEALASHFLREASATLAARDFWPASRWWLPNGWEVVAEIAAEGCVGDAVVFWRLIGWLAQVQPEVAYEAWQRAGAPDLPPSLAAEIARNWLPRLTDEKREPSSAARAAIGRALAGFDLDHRPGVGVRFDGLPDIDWVAISGKLSFIYQKGKMGPPVELTLPDFEIARYPITNRQFQAFIDAGGYADDRWWVGLKERMEAPLRPEWQDANAPRETVSWYEAVAFCRWLGHALCADDSAIQLPTEHQWERAARGTEGNEYPWQSEYRAGFANCAEHVAGIEGGTYFVGRTSAVGIYPHPSAEGVHDLVGNVWEWCLDEYVEVKRSEIDGAVFRMLRGGSWSGLARDIRAGSLYAHRADGRGNYFGFRVCRASPSKC